jgi:hypothetical protein
LFYSNLTFVIALLSTTFFPGLYLTLEFVLGLPFQSKRRKVELEQAKLILAKSEALASARRITGIVCNHHKFASTTNVHFLLLILSVIAEEAEARKVALKEREAAEKVRCPLPHFRT